jgi:hypothetical protein
MAGSKGRVAVGDRIRCDLPGSWVDGRVMIVTALGVRSSDDIEGHALRDEGLAGFTVLGPDRLTLVSPHD